MNLAIQSIADGWLAASKAASQLSIRHPRGAQAFNFIYVGVGKLRHCRALHHLVSVVVCGSSNPKMLGVNTARIVSTGAIVKHQKPIRDWPAVDYPRNMMSENLGASLRADDVVIDHSPVSTGVARRPNPARFSLLNVLPESLNNCWGKVLRSQVLGSNFVHVFGFAAYGLRILRGTFIIGTRPQTAN